MHTFPFTSLATLISLAVFFWTSILVAAARKRYSVPAPAVVGNEMFERCFRVQMNTLEQLTLLVPVLWLCALWVGDLYAAAVGIIWSLGRVVYATAYRQDPKKRGPGFLITLSATMAMAAAVVIFVVRSMI